MKMKADMKNMIYLIPLAVLVAHVCHASDQPPSDANAELLASSAVGEEVRSEHEIYRIIPSGHVIDVRDSSARRTRTAVAGDVWSSRLGPFQLVIQGSQATRALTLNTSSKYRLAYNPRTGKPAIVTNRIIVSLNPGASAVDIAAVYGLELRADHSHINAAFFETSDPDELTEKVDLLKSDPRVVDAYPEVIENLPTAR